VRLRSASWAITAPKASVAGEVIPSDDFYSYRAKYIDDSSDLIIPAQIPADTLRLVQDYAIRAFEAIDGAGMARIDFLLDKDTGDIFLNELNTIPGFNQDKYVPQVVGSQWIPYPELVDRFDYFGISNESRTDGSKGRYKR